MEKTFRIVGLLEGLSFLILLGIAMPLKYFADLPLAVRYVGAAHGALFVAYILAARILAYQKRWTLARLALVVVAATVPFGTFVFDRRVFGDKR